MNDNTKKTHNEDKKVAEMYESKCGLCEDTFTSNEDFKNHIAEHKEEIDEIDIVSLTNYHEMFKCNLCSFESGYDGSIREHFMDHVNYSLTVDTTDKSVEVKQREHKLCDEYDDDGNYIGDDPRFMDSEPKDSKDEDTSQIM